MAEFIVVHSIKVATEFVPETFGRLTTIGPRFRLQCSVQGLKTSHQVCQCTCGNVCVVRISGLKNGSTASCGCRRREEVIKRNTKHGECRRGKLTKEYSGWVAMMQRCYNIKHESYPDYGGRGITVCDRWREPDGVGFTNFIDDMGRKPSSKHSIERKLVNGNYCPENCCWATDNEQARNRRNNVYLTHNGKTQCLSAWAKELGIPDGTLRDRLKSGMPIERALTKPVKGRVRGTD